MLRASTQLFGASNSQTIIGPPGLICQAPCARRGSDILCAWAGYTGEGEEHSMESIDPLVQIGHVHLKVADLNRALSFYCDVLGFSITQRLGGSAAFISAGGYHHHIGLNTWESLGGSPPPASSTGMYHLAIRYPSRRALADALSRLVASGIAVDGASDHGVSEALYLRDPDSNGLELYWDRPATDWPRTPNGELAMYTRSLDITSLLSELDRPNIVPDSGTRSLREG